MKAEQRTFGVELEIIVAEATPGLPHPNPEEGRITEFQRANTKARRAKAIEERVNKIAFFPFTSEVLTHIRNTMRTAGFTVQEPNQTRDISQWDVKHDQSIENDGQNTGYTWHGVEIVSPAYYYTSEALKAVQAVCALLTNNYCVSVNKSCGLHVHVSNGTKEGHSFDTLKKLAAFLWAFTPQLSTLHPDDRQSNNPHIGGMRDASALAAKRQRSGKERATPEEGVALLLNAESRQELLKKTFKFYGIQKSMQYNFYNLSQITEYTGLPSTPTIEFRQHAGSLNGVAVTKWIETVIGIVDFCSLVMPFKLYDLLHISTKNEKWEKRLDGKDDVREREMGPILADSKITVIDLLKEIGLYRQAEYYEQRGIYPSKLAPGSNPFVEYKELCWEYARNDLGMSQIHKKRTQLLRNCFECLDKITRIQRKMGQDIEGKERPFNPKASYWPNHDKKLDNLEQDTDDDTDEDSDEEEEEDDNKDDDEKNGSQNDAVKLYDESAGNAHIEATFATARANERRISETEAQNPPIEQTAPHPPDSSDTSQTHSDTVDSADEPQHLIPAKGGRCMKLVSSSSGSEDSQVAVDPTDHDSNPQDIDEGGLTTPRLDGGGFKAHVNGELPCYDDNDAGLDSEQSDEFGNGSSHTGRALVVEETDDSESVARQLAALDNELVDIEIDILVEELRALASSNCSFTPSEEAERRKEHELMGLPFSESSTRRVESWLAARNRGNTSESQLAGLTAFDVGTKAVTEGAESDIEFCEERRASS